MLSFVLDSVCRLDSVGLFCIVIQFGIRCDSVAILKIGIRCVREFSATANNNAGVHDIVDFYRENPDLVTKEWERRMADALVDLSDTANVTVTFAFKGSMESEKISVENVLRCLRDSTYISPYQFVTNKAGKVLMAKLGLSISDDLHCYDIVSIKYGKKILFER